MKEEVNVCEDFLKDKKNAKCFACDTDLCNGAESKTLTVWILVACVTASLLRQMGAL